MSKYHVYYTSQLRGMVEVEADSKKEARAKVLNMGTIKLLYGVDDTRVNGYFNTAVTQCLLCKETT
jgi:hypothetical protein